jgi:uncharacterized oligopeptide transporter (OPT) family protein
MSEKPFTPYVPADSTMREFTLRALLLGLFMCVILGAANAYLGLKAGMTIAATYPAAVIGMAVLRLMKGSLLEENFARTVGSIGESIAAGAIFTIPAFVLLGYWKFNTFTDYLTASALMIVGGILGIMFVTMLRRVMVEDPDLKFPESVAASEIHKAGQRGAEAAVQLFKAMGVGAVVRLLDAFGVFSSSNAFPVAVGRVKQSLVRLGLSKDAPAITAGGVSSFSAPAVSPAYIGVGYIIGPELGALNFAGGLLAWGLFVPLLVFFLGPNMIDQYTAAAAGDQAAAWGAIVGHLYRFVVRPIAVGGMLVGACFTLFKMRKNLGIALKRAIADLKKSAGAYAATSRIDRDINFKFVVLGLVGVLILMIALYSYFTKAIGPAFLAAIVMLVTGFFFAAVSGNLVGMIGSSNNHRRGPHDGDHRLQRGGRRRCRPRRCGRWVRLRSGRRRNAAGPQGRSHPRRDSLEDAGRRPDRRRCRRCRDVLPALRAALRRPQAVPGQRRLRESAPAGTASRPDGGALLGDRRRRDGMAIGHRRYRDGDLAHPHQGEESDVVLGRHVPPPRDDLCHLRGRDHPRHRGQDARPARV